MSQDSFSKALKHHQEPPSITLDGHQPSHSALQRMGMNGEFHFRGPNPVTIRCCQYLNNVVEQDHHRVKGHLRRMLGFKTFLQCATRHYRHRAGPEDSQTPVRNSNPMAVESCGDLATSWQHSPHRRGALRVLSLRQSWLYQNRFSAFIKNNLLPLS